MKSIAISVILILIFIPACFLITQNDDEPFTVQQAGILCEEGQALLDSGEIVQAEIRFKRALQLYPECVGALLGLAKIELERRNFKNAELRLDKVLEKDSNIHEARLLKAQLLFDRGRYQNVPGVIAPVLKSADQKLVREALMLLSRVYVEQAEYEKAEAALGKLSKEDAGAAEVKTALTEVRKLRRITNGQPIEILKLISEKAITRSDAALLFTTIFPLQQLLNEKTTNDLQRSASAIVTPADVPPAHPSAETIYRALRYGVIDLLPDGSFRPEYKINRGVLALLIENFLILLSDDPATGKRYYKSDTSPFSDLPAHHPVFNAAMLAVENDIMPFHENRRFAPRETVSGREALEAFYNLKQYFIQSDILPDTK